jgi:hypothetical protein
MLSGQIINHMFQKIEELGCQRKFGNDNDIKFIRQQIAHTIVNDNPIFGKNAPEFIENGKVGGEEVEISPLAVKTMKKYILGAVKIIENTKDLWDKNLLNFLTSEAALTAIQKDAFGNNGQNIILRFSSLLNSPGGIPTVVLQNKNSDKLFKGSIDFNVDLEIFSLKVEKLCLQSKSIYAILQRMRFYTGIAKVGSNLDVEIEKKSEGVDATVEEISK